MDEGLSSGMVRTAAGWPPSLFSRFDFTADLDTADAADPATTTVAERTSFRFSDPQGFCASTANSIVLFHGTEVAVCRIHHL
jgi:hypothetical protein